MKTWQKWSFVSGLIMGVEEKCGWAKHVKTMTEDDGKLLVKHI